jgi:CRP-like cAMP-binding protein
VSVDDHVSRLGENPALGGLSKDVVERIVRAASTVEWPAGQVLARADDPGVGMFVLQEGRVVVEAPGRTIELEQGAIFGELSLLVPESRRVARVRALTPVRCLTIDRTTFEELLHDEPAFALAMLRVVSRRLWDVMRGQ